MIKGILLSLFIICCQMPLVYATTYIVRCDGGTPAQCDGTHDAPLAGAIDGADPGTTPDCALNSYNYVVGANTNTGGAAGLMAAGDTVIIDGELRAGCIQGTNSGRAEYEVGLGAPNMSSGNNCNVAFPYGCILNNPPAGSSAGFPTKIYGKGYDTGCKTPPQLWGQGGIYSVMQLPANAELRCVEITDHSGCMFRHDGYGNIDNSASQDPIACSEDYSSQGSAGRYARGGLRIVGGAHDFVIKDVWIHGLAYHAIDADSLTGAGSITNLYLRTAGYAGWTANDNAHYSGNYTWTGGGLWYIGCGEKYPPTYPIGRTRTKQRDATDVHNCWTQGQGAGYGDALGANIRWGNWTFSYIDIFAASSDGLDQLYDSVGSEKVIGITCEANTGACYKSSALTVDIENSVILGNCARNKPGQNPTLYGDSSATGRSGSSCNNNGQCNANENSTSCGDCSAYGACRPTNHTPISLVGAAGSNITVLGNTITGNSDVLLTIGGTTYNGTTNITVKNNIFVGATEYNGGEADTADAYFQTGTGTPNLVQDYNIFAHTKTYSSDCIGTHDLCYSNENSVNFVGPISNFKPTYYTGTNYLASYYLQVTSPAHSATAADETVTLQGAASDATKFSRRTTWDAGGIEYRPTLHLATDYYNVSQ